MREIKFRVWDNVEHKMYKHAQYGICEESDQVVPFGNLLLRGYFEIMQYIGLHDKNGTEIYEGDILRLWRSVGSNGELRREHYKPLPVTYCSIWCQFVANDESTKNQYCIWNDFGAFEVVGNVYQNSELMKESD